MLFPDWKTHGSEYYECSRYKENPNVVNEGAQAQAREALKKYLFYFERVCCFCMILSSSLMYQLAFSPCVRKVHGLIPGLATMQVYGVSSWQHHWAPSLQTEQLIMGTGLSRKPPSKYAQPGLHWPIDCTL